MFSSAHFPGHELKHPQSGDQTFCTVHRDLLWVSEHTHSQGATPPSLILPPPTSPDTMRVTQAVNRGLRPLLE